MRKLNIWCLFDDGYGSWNKFSKDKEDNYLSIGINDNNWSNYYKINLSIQNENLIKELEKLPKPDIIIASPPCESWSIADNQQRLWRGQNGNNIKVYLKKDIEYNNKTLNDIIKQIKTKKGGEL